MIILNFGIRNQIVTIFRAREPGMCIAFNKKLLYFTIKRKTILQKTRFYAILEANQFSKKGRATCRK